MLTRDEILRICGELPDWKLARIEASGATDDELLVAINRVQGQDDVIARARKPLAGRAAHIYEILIADEDIWGEERQP